MRNLAAKLMLCLGLSFGSVPAFAGIPVIDGASLIQEIIGYIESVAQTVQQYTSYAKQVQEYQTQLEQYENQVRNTIGTYQNIYSNAKGAIEGFERFDNFFDEFHDLSYYKSAGNSLRDFGRLVNKSIETGSRTKKEVGDIAARTIQKVQESGANEADGISKIESASVGSEGQVQAQQYGNQLAAQQATQILKLRQELAAYNNAQLAHYAAEADKQAAIDAATNKSIAWTSGQSPGKTY